MVTKVKKPQDMEKVRAAAWGAALGEPVSSMEKLAGVTNNTIRNWMISDWWQDEVEDARALIPQVIRDRALSGILQGLEDPQEYAAMARWAGERVVPYLKPPVQRRDHTSDGKPIAPLPTRVEVVHVPPAEDPDGKAD